MEQDNHSLSDYYSACVAGIEVHIFGAAASPKAPVIFLTHGRGGEVRHVFGYCRELAALGYIAIGVEQRNHGKRLVDPEANGGWSLHHAADMVGIFTGTALDISYLIDAIPARLGIGMERVGMTGVSLGGHATLSAMALDSRISVGVPLIGSGDYRTLMHERARANGAAGEFDRCYPPELDAMVRKYDPIHRPEAFADRPLLMLNGADDTLVPPGCNENLYQALRPFYRHPDRLKFHVMEGVGHAVPDPMWQMAREWFLKNLQPR